MPKQVIPLLIFYFLRISILFSRNNTCYLFFGNQEIYNKRTASCSNSCTVKPQIISACTKTETLKNSPIQLKQFQYFKRKTLCKHCRKHIYPHSLHRTKQFIFQIKKVYFCAYFQTWVTCSAEQAQSELGSREKPKNKFIPMHTYKENTFISK